VEPAARQPRDRAAGAWQWARTAGTQRALLDAARTVFVERGFANASIAEVVQRADSSVGSLYHHFGGKSELFIALWQEYQHAQEEAASKAVAQARKAGVTDSLDGYFARRLGQISRLGAFLDPVADKLIVAVALVLLVSRDPRPLIVLTAVVIIGREITISALREWMAEIGARRKVAVSQLGKYKTILQIVGLSMMLYRAPLLGLQTYQIGVELTVIAAAATLLSMVFYLRAAWPDLKR